MSSGGQVYIADNSFGIDRVRTLALPPAIAPGGVVPLNSSAATILPGAWLSIYGTHLGSATMVATGNLPTSLGGTSVTIDSMPSYLGLVSPTQINCQAPNTSTNGVVKVTVTTSGGSVSAMVTLGGPTTSNNAFMPLK